MAAILLVLAVLSLVVLGDAVVENTTSTDFTLFGQQIGGFTHGGSLAIAAALGALATCLLLLAFAASSRRRIRRKELRSSHHDLEDRIAELERENADLRSQPVGVTAGAGTRPAPAAPRARQADVLPEPPRREPTAPPPPPGAVHERPVAAPPPAAAEQPAGHGATRMERLRGDADDPADDRARPI